DPDDLPAAIMQARKLEPAVCRKHVESGFTVEVMAEGYEDVYRRALSMAPEPWLTGLDQAPIISQVLAGAGSLQCVAARGTRATEELTKLGTAHTVHAFDHDDLDGPRGGSYGMAAAAELGVPPGQVFKTLIAAVDGSMTVAVVPVAGQLNLKALAQAVGGKPAEMAEPA